MSTLEEFLAGERHDDVALFLAEHYVEDERLKQFGERVDGGTVIVVDGERGRNAFEAATGTPAMAFAGTAMNREGDVADDLSDGTCPDDSNVDKHDDHEVQFVFAFTEVANEDVGGIYGEGDVLHAYAQCTCGTAYSDRWVLP